MKLSIVIAARNAADNLPFLLDAVLPQMRAEDEIFLVNDASTDSTAVVAARYPLKLISLGNRAGPAGARNRGAAEATGEVLIFFDADVVPHARLLESFAEYFANHPEWSAVIGAYDDSPTSRATVSLFRNLLHCYTHRTGKREASTFWAACGGIRRQIFHELGGFDQQRFPEPTIEDIELGVRLRRRGCRIVLAPELQVQHRKIWTLRNMIATDVWHRAVPWSRLIFESREAPADLNLKFSQRYSAAATVSAAGLLAVSFWTPLPITILGAALLGSVALVNWRFYRFLAARGGWWFALRSIPLHILYYLCSAAGLGIALFQKWTSPK